MRMLGLSVIVAAALSAGVGAASGQASGLSRAADRVTVDTKLAKDLVNCSNNGLVIGSDNISST